TDSASRFEFEVQGDLLISRQRFWDVKTVESWVALCDRVLAEHRGAFAILDTTQGMEISAEARRRLAKEFRERQLNLCVVVGASLPTRALFTLGARAISILRGRPARICFADTLGQAQALVAQTRAKRT